jgi:hypothetical protein
VRRPTETATRRGEQLRTAIAIGLFGLGCVHRYSVPAPTPGTFGIPPVHASVATVPVQADLTGLVAELKRSLPPSLDSGTEHVKLELHNAPGLGGLLAALSGSEVEVRHEVTWVDTDVDLRGNILTASATVDVVVSAKLDSPLVKTDLASCGVDEPPARIKLSVWGAVSIRSDGSLVLQRQGDRLDWLRPCNLTALNIPADSMLRLPVVKQLIDEKLNAALDRLPTSYSFRPLLESAWATLSQRIRIADEIWLVLEPTGLAVTQPDGAGKVVSIVASITAHPRIVYGKEPSSSPQPLPEISLEVPADRRFVIEVPGALSLAAANERLRRALVGGHNVSGHPVEVQDAAVYGRSDGTAVVAVTISSPVSATLYLAGTPFFDRDSDTIGLSGLDYTAQTRTVLSNVAEFLLHDVLRDVIRSAARFSLASTRRKAEDALSKLHFNGSLYSLDVKAESIRPLGVAIDDHEISAAIAVEGTASIAIALPRKPAE